MKVFVFDSSNGDCKKSYIELVCPFEKQDVPSETLEYFRHGVADLYNDFAKGTVKVVFDFEINCEHFSVCLN